LDALRLLETGFFTLEAGCNEVLLWKNQGDRPRAQLQRNRVFHLGGWL